MTETLAQFQALTSYVPGIGTMIGALAGFAKSLNGSEPQILNPFKGGGFAGGMYDPPPVWRASVVQGNMFAGILWGYPVTDDVVNPLAGKFITAAGSLKTIFQKDVVDLDQAQAMVKAVFARRAKPPATPTFYYLDSPNRSEWFQRRFEGSRAWAVENRKVNVFLGEPHYAGTHWETFSTWRTWHKKNKPGELEAAYELAAASASEPLAAELADYAAFIEALRAEQERAAFIGAAVAQAEAAAAAAYEYSLNASGGGNVPPPLAPPMLPPEPVFEPEPVQNPVTLLDMSAPAAKPAAPVPVAAAAAGGLGLLALLL